MSITTITACCAPVTEAALGEDEAEQLAAAFKVLADPVRLRLLSLVANAEGGEACGCDLTEPVGRSQPTVSHHLSILTDAGLLDRAIYVERGAMADQVVMPLADKTTDDAPYFSIVLVHGQGRRP